MVASEAAPFAKTGGLADVENNTIWVSNVATRDGGVLFLHGAATR